MPLAIVSVTNDLTTDQRVDRTCRTLVKAGYDVLLVGRKRRISIPLRPRPYRTKRMRLVFDKGPFFYAEYNFRLFWYLLFHQYELIVSNDLDTLAANYLANRVKRSLSKIRNPKFEIRNPKSEIRHLHDCHEYFRGVPELNGRNKVLRVWKWIEDRIFPSLGMVMAVNRSVADLYGKEYGKRIEVIRNVPFRKPASGKTGKSSFGIRDDRKIILYQGAVNVGRGIEEAILAMKHVKTNALLVIAGIGDLYDKLKEFPGQAGVAEKVRFMGQVPLEELHSLTSAADIGLSIEKDISVNYRYCLPNKFLDYIQAGVPVLVSPFPEMKGIVDHYMIGEFIGGHDPAGLALHMDSMLSDKEKLAIYRRNLEKAAEELCWENEEPKLLKIVTRDG